MRSKYRVYNCEFRSSELYTAPAQNSTDLASQLQNTLGTLLEKHIPLKSKKVFSRQPKPWFNSEIREAKRKRSQLERCWRCSRLPSDQSRFKAQSKLTRKLVTSARSSYLTNLVTENSSNPRSLWKTLNQVLHRNSSGGLPTNSDPSSLATAFLHFFGDKIARIRNVFPDSCTNGLSVPEHSVPTIDSFSPATTDEVRSVIFSCSNKQCLLDAIPTSLLKECFDVLGHLLTSLINLSLSEGSFPSLFSHAIVNPLLKKPSLDADNLSKYIDLSLIFILYRNFLNV